MSKWDLGWSEGRYPSNQGFDKFNGVETTDATVWRELPGFAESGLEGPVVMQGQAGKPASVARDHDIEYRAWIDGDLTDRAVEYIERMGKEENPFFLYLAYTATHYPTIPHPDFDGAIGNGPWADTLHQTDSYVGRVTGALAAASIADDTIIIFTADNVLYSERLANLASGYCRIEASRYV